MAHHIHKGGGVAESDDGFTLLQKAIEKAPDGEHWPRYTGDQVIDEMERRVALGLPPIKEE